MRNILILLLTLFAAPVLAAPIPTFDSPEALLTAIYDQIEASNDWENYDWDASFDETDAFSARLRALLEQADAIVNPSGEDIGALDFSPFINGQDAGGMTFTLGTSKTKGGRAVMAVDIAIEDRPWQTITFQLVDEGDGGWKVDDIALPGETAGESWLLSDYLADPLGEL